MLHYYLTFSFNLKLALLTQLPTSNERKIPPHLKIKPAKFHNGGFTQDLYMHICSISVKFRLWKNSMNALKSVARTQRVNGVFSKVNQITIMSNLNTIHPTMGKFPFMGRSQKITNCPSQHLKILIKKM